MKITSNLPPPRKITIKERVLQYVVITDEIGNTLIRRREEKISGADCMNLFWKKQRKKPHSVHKNRIYPYKNRINVSSESPFCKEYKHILTHQRLLVKFYHVKLKGRIKEKNYSGYQAESVKTCWILHFQESPGYIWVTKSFNKRVC